MNTELLEAARADGKHFDVLAKPFHPSGLLELLRDNTPLYRSKISCNSSGVAPNSMPIPGASSWMAPFGSARIPTPRPASNGFALPFETGWRTRTSERGGGQRSEPNHVEPSCGVYREWITDSVLQRRRSKGDARSASERRIATR